MFWTWRRRLMVATVSDLVMLTTDLPLSDAELAQLREGFRHAQQTLLQGDGPTLLLLPPGVTVALVIRGPR